VTAPPTRLDIQAGAADLIEELARVSGYDRLPERRLPLELPVQQANRSLDLEEAVRDLLADAGLTEVITYSLSSERLEGLVDPSVYLPTIPEEKPTDPTQYSATDIKIARPYVTIRNPISLTHSSMRQSLLPRVLEVTAENLKNAVGVALFELGPVFLPKPKEKLPDEPRRIALVLSGRRTDAAWDDPLGVDPPRYDFFDLKGVVETLASDLHLPAVTFAPAKDVPHLHPGRAARLLVNGNPVGAFGELHPKVASAFKLADRAVLVGEFDLEAILAGVPERFAYRPISPFPPVLRDVAVVVAEDVPAEKIETEARAAAGELLEDLRLFDVYRGDSIPAGTKSLAYAITYRVPGRQLGDKEVDKAHQKIEGRLRHVLKAQIRGKDGV
jgi:phenylalanyl-tRNA synthetase beta chain